MKVFGLDGKTHNINFEKSNARGKVSSFHEKARDLIKDIFPITPVYEEVTIPGAGPVLYADFFIPKLKMVVEVHGKQHYQYVQHFHGNINGFKASRNRDALKKEWCELNNIDYIELSYKEDLDEWREKIINIQ